MFSNLRLLGQLAVVIKKSQANRREQARKASRDMEEHSAQGNSQQG